ncbi:MAG: hypothetical protein NW201_11915 [Gemmatimonadales bacterium]|nr:hypothetical protein [Gemmatimonadales bacterium]
MSLPPTGRLPSPRLRFLAALFCCVALLPAGAAAQIVGPAPVPPDLPPGPPPPPPLIPPIAQPGAPPVAPQVSARTLVEAQWAGQTVPVQLSPCSSVAPVTSSTTASISVSDCSLPDLRGTQVARATIGQSIGARSELATFELRNTSWVRSTSAATLTDVVTFGGAPDRLVFNAPLTGLVDLPAFNAVSSLRLRYAAWALPAVGDATPLGWVEFFQQRVTQAGVLTTHWSYMVNGALPPAGGLGIGTPPSVFETVIRAGVTRVQFEFQLTTEAQLYTQDGPVWGEVLTDYANTLSFNSVRLFQGQADVTNTANLRFASGGTYTAPTTVVPEPATLVFGATGLALLGLVGRRRR